MDQDQPLIFLVLGDSRRHTNTHNKSRPCFRELCKGRRDTPTLRQVFVVHQDCQHQHNWKTVKGNLDHFARTSAESFLYLIKVTSRILHGNTTRARTPASVVGLPLFLSPTLDLFCLDTLSVFSKPVKPYTTSPLFAERFPSNSRATSNQTLRTDHSPPRTIPHLGLGGHWRRCRSRCQHSRCHRLRRGC